MSITILKIIALFCMILDHIGFFFPNMKYYLFLRIIGRIAAPIYFFCFVEGYKHTHNKKIYRNKLFISSILMMIINAWMITFLQLLHHPLPNGINILTPNMFFTFFILFQILEGMNYIIDVFKQKKSNSIENIFINKHKLLKVLYICFIPFIEYKYIAFCSVLIFFYIDNKYIKYLLFIISNVIICLLLKNKIELFMLLSIIPLYFYNGKRGNYNSSFFYIIYPLHFYFLALLTIF